MRFYSILLFILSGINISRSQATLTLPQAIQLAVQNNYLIAISANEADISRNNIARGNAGMLPEVNFNAGASFSGIDTKQEYSNGSEVDKKAAKSNNLHASLNFDWLVFDGLKMFVRYDKLKELNNWSQYASKVQIENTVVQVISAYYNLVRQQQLISLNEYLQTLYEERLKIAKVRWDIGKSAKTDFLQAQLDYNFQKSNHIKLINEYASIRSSLNQILSRTIETAIQIKDSILVDTSLELNAIQSNILLKNNSLLLQQSNVKISEFNLEEFQKDRYPQVYLNANYNFTRTNNQAGFILYNQNLGWNAGFTLNWNLFNGYNSRREIANARIQLNIAQLQLEANRSEISTTLYQSFYDYKSALEILRLENENIRIAQENMDIFLESFRLGKANTLEVKEAQRNYEDALNRQVQSLYEAKLAETQLLKLQGELVK